MSGWRLVADVGGTNVRFARAGHDGALAHIRHAPTAGIASFCEAMRDYLATIGGAMGCSGVAIGAAGPIEDGQVQLTNGAWEIQSSAVSEALAGIPVGLFNDLEAIALALPVLAGADVTPIGAGNTADRRKAMLAVNVGTGFGAAACLPLDGGWITVPGESGHMSLSDEVYRALDVPPLGPSIEDLLSGRGVAALYRAVRGASKADATSSESVFEKATADIAAQRVTRAFTRCIGSVAGDLALATGAWGGVFLCGGVVSGWIGHADAADFRAGFEAKGAMSERMRHVFTGRIARGDAALIGLARARLPAG